MFRKFLIFLLLLILGENFCFANVLDSALQNNDRVFLYFYTNNCGYCKRFNPVYDKMLSKYGNKYKFLKVDADKNEGSVLFKEYKGYYVPYVLLFVKNSNKVLNVSPNCLINEACIDEVLTNNLK